MVVPFKDTEHLSFKGPLKAYIASAFAEDPSQYADDLAALDAARLQIQSPQDHDESALAHLRYFGHLQLLAGKFVIDENHIQIAFTWGSALNKDKDYSKKHEISTLARNTVFSPTSYSVGFEKASVLFNLAAIYSHLAAQVPLSTDDTFKRAASYFQQSAGVFAYIVENISGWGIGTGSAMQLNSLSQLMLGEAQEIFFLKAQAGNMKDATLAKLAAQTSVFYSSAYDYAIQTQVFDKSWLNFFHTKVHQWKATADYHKSLELFAAGKYGEQIAWLDAALIASKKANEPSLLKHVALPKVQADVKALQTMIEKALVQANKDNDVIYMEIVPRPESLAPISPAKMVAPTPFPDSASLSKIVGKALFMHLVPFEVHQAASEYIAKKDTLVNNTNAKLTEATSIAFTTLASINLPGAIQALEQPIGLPESLVRRSEEVRSLGGSQALNSTWDTLMSLSNKSWSILKEAMEYLDRESAEDQSLHVQFGSRWTRATSTSLSQNLREGEQKLRKKLQDADNANRIVRTKMDSQLHLIESISVSRETLEASIPASKVESTLALKDPNVKQLRVLLDRINANIKRRTEILARLKEVAAADDIVPRLLDDAVKGTALNKAAVFDAQLKIYEPLTAESNDLIAQQDSLLQDIVKCNKAFMESRQANELIRQRENALQSLENGYKAFKEIMTNLDEGIKFYSDIEGPLNKFLGNCKDFAMARDIEKRDMVAQIQNNIASLRFTDGAAVASPAGAPPASSLPPPQTFQPTAPHAYGTWQQGQPLQYGAPQGAYGAMPQGQYGVAPPTQYGVAPVGSQPIYNMPPPGSVSQGYYAPGAYPSQPQYGQGYPRQ
eukprot:jgi/Hompol1/2102/HPOL_002823-RA